MFKPGFLSRMVNKSGSNKGGVPPEWSAAILQQGSGQVLDQPYRYSAWVQAAIKMVSGPIASVPPIFCRPDPSEAVRVRTTYASIQKRYQANAKRSEIDMEATRAFWHSPVHEGSYTHFVEATIGWLQLKGEAFWILDDAALVNLPFPDLRNFPQVVIARPDRMREILDEKNAIVGWEYLTENGTAKLLPEQVIHLRCWNPYSDHRGLGSYSSAANATESDWFAAKFIRSLMARNTDAGMGDYIVAQNGVASNEQREQIISDLRSKREATLRGTYRPVFLSGDFRVEDSTVKNVDADFWAQRRENRTEIFTAFGVPPSLAHIAPSYVEGVNSTQMELIMTTCIPLGEKLAIGLSQLASRMTGQNIEVFLNWDEHPVLQEVKRTRFKGADTLFKCGVPMDVISEHLNLGLGKFRSSNRGFIPDGIAPVSEVASSGERIITKNAAFARRYKTRRTK